ncbi:FAST kinase domain-containing protein 1, mitochondrial isoform X2 [Diorhabda sublineata]|uniref:FAST kinase domain-containing protein 1, mitochondrial isoform X2 n=1 Tax=Diorhabda sublineata TaxID=1163346 RepID=UPI0024E13E92|nr:FAST kinase domain-containing protein 1, mitochondrial isoform X2 [Diorhabda sublineata]
MYRLFRILRNKSNFKKNFSNLTYSKHSKICGVRINIERTLKHQNHRQYSLENEEPDDYPLLETEILDTPERTKYLLFKNSDDTLVNQLNNCLCIEDVWNLFEKYKNEMSERHLTQTILVLRDLQVEYSTINCFIDNASLFFFNKLKDSPAFTDLLNKIINKLPNFNIELLSYTFSYLHKIGLHIEDYPMCIIAENLRRNLLEDFDIGTCSRWIKVIFHEGGIRPYFLTLPFIPNVLKLLDECDSIEDFESITTCLMKLESMVTKSVIEKYIDKVEHFLENKKLTGDKQNAVLKIITFLSNPSWRDQHVPLMSKCILLLKNEFNQFDASRLLHLYEIFFKIQEPGDLLNDIQRSAAKYWQQYEESGNLDTNTALKLFSALIYFNSPLQRIQLRKDINKLIKDKMRISNLILLRKIFSYIKISDYQLCHKYWQLWGNIIQEDNSIHLLIKACHNYMQFNTDIDNYRNKTFEKQAVQQIIDIVQNDRIIFPSDLTVLLTFVTLYAKDKSLIQIFLEKFKSNPYQLKGLDCLMLSRIFINKNNCSQEQYSEIKCVLNEASQYLLSLNHKRFETNALLIKAAILRNEYNNYEIDNLIMAFKEMDYMSSKFLETISYIFLSTNTLVPEVFNKMTEYVVNKRGNIVGFNAEKLLFLCFYLAYFPINADKFFLTITDIIIRDQERLSGLAFLQSALSLSFFNKLPSFLVKQIFNVEFMDRLDNELANCYSKDKYPQRVRQTLMYLNRAVCLEYPQFGVPWFHEKYIQETQKRYSIDDEFNIVKSIKEYLVEIAGNDVLENVITPYGYHIDFIINLNKEDKIVPPHSKSISKRMALLLVRNYAFTRLYIHLRGTYQMKIRHLEIMGYNVSIMKFDEWTNLLYSSERIEYLKKLIWPDNWETVRCISKR